MDDVPDNSVIINSFDYSEYIWNSTLKIWLNYGNGFFIIASNEHLGVVKGTPDPGEGDGSKDNFITVLNDGTMKLIKNKPTAPFFPDYGSMESVNRITGNFIFSPVDATGLGTNYLYALAYGNGKFVAAGADNRIAYSEDGITWITVNDSNFGTNTIRGLTYAKVV
jgi:hypothetical protein